MSVDLERLQLIACAIMHTVQTRTGEHGYTGQMERLFAITKEKWDGPYSLDDWREAFELLKDCRVASQSAFDAASDFIRISGDWAMLYQSSSKYRNPAKQLPIIHEFQTFGIDWLRSLWQPYIVHADPSLAPAASGFVSFDHNSKKHSDARNSLDELEKALRTGNDVGDMTAADVAIAIHEVAQLKDSLEQPIIRISNFKRRANESLKWIGQQAAGAVVGTLAIAALSAIAALFGLL